MKMDAVGTYRSFASIYDNYVGGFKEDLPLYKSLCAGKDPILEIGCGTGRVLEALLTEKHVMTGVDISPEMLAIAHERLKAFVQQGALTLLNRNFISSALPGKFRGALITFYTINYILDYQDLLRLLRNARTSLTPDGLVAIDLLYPKTLKCPELEGEWETEEVRGGSPPTILAQRKRMTGNLEERLQVFQTGADRKEILTHRMYYEKETIVTALEESGFKEIEITDGYELSGFHKLEKGEPTRRSFVVKGKSGA